jgi:hypothetical protein
LAGLLGAAAAALAFHGAVRGAPAPGPPVSPAVVPVAAAAVNADGSFLLTLTVKGSLSGIQPDAVKASWLCSARILKQPAVDAEVAKLKGLSGPAARAEFNSFLEDRAHYLGQQVTVGVPLVSGTTGTVLPINLTMKRDDLVDPVSHRAIDQPAVLVGCWLRLTNAAGGGGFAIQVPNPPASVADPVTNMLQVSTQPWVIASSSIPNE